MLRGPGGVRAQSVGRPRTPYCCCGAKCRSRRQTSAAGYASVWQLLACVGGCGAGGWWLAAMLGAAAVVAKGCACGLPTGRLSVVVVAIVRA